MTSSSILTLDLDETSTRATGGVPPVGLRHRVVGLFAGIGGIELGMSRAGHQTLELCEIDAGARAVLQERFPHATLTPDITTLTDLRADATMITAGFPCQDLSQAGRTAGIHGSKSGLINHLFALLERHPVPWVLLENVSFMLRLGRGEAFRHVIDQLEQLGYRWAYRVIDTQAFGLPQRRQRVYLLASLTGDPRHPLLAADAGPPAPRQADGLACGFYWTEGIRGLGWAVDAIPTLKGGSTIGIPSPPAILLPSGRVIKPDVRDGERLQGFPTDWTLPAESVVRHGYRWKLIGNAVTVDVAEWLGQQLISPAAYDARRDRPLHAGQPWPTAAWSLGDGRFASFASAWPVHRTGPLLTDFLEFEGVPLSARATAGFLGRARTSSLRFPPGFLDALETHLTTVQTGAD
jgi:DNA (cytosine-5)-methyltransferase 1